MAPYFCRLCLQDNTCVSLFREIGRLRITMNQSRINLVMILHLNKEKVDNLDLDVIGNEFVEGNQHHLKYFGKFK